MSAKRGIEVLNYQFPDSALTLRQGIKELRDFEGPQGDASIQMGAENDHVMKAHDAVHVVFGCSTSIEDEVIAHLAMLLGTDVKLSDIRKVAKAKEHKQVIRGHSGLKIFAVVAMSVLDLYAVYRLKRQMKKRWPWHGYAAHLDRSIEEIREEFGIHPIRRSARFG
jgi:hypothetical protein